MARVKRSTALTLIFIIFMVVLVAAATITYFYAKKNDVGRVNITLVYGTYSDSDGFVKEEASQNTIHTTVKSVRIGSLANLNYHDFDRMGHSIEGWYLDSDFESKFESGTTIKEDLTLYAKWQLQSYTIRFFSSADGSVNNTNYLETSQTYVYNTDVQVKDADGNYIGGFVNPFNGVNGKYDYIRKPYHEFTGWTAKTVTAEETFYDDTYYEVNSFKMPAKDINFVVKWEKFQAKIKLVDGVLDGTNSDLKPVTGGYYVKNENSSLFFNEDDIISYSILENGFRLVDVKNKIDYNNQEQAMTFERIGWKTNNKDSQIFGYNEADYQIKLSDGKLVEETENGKIIDRYYEIDLNANWQKEQVTLNFYTGENNKVVSKQVDSYSVVDVSDIYNSNRRSGSIIIGWAIPKKLIGDVTKLQYKNYEGYKEDDVNYFISSQDYKIINDDGEIVINETNANDSKTLKTLGRRWSEDLQSSDVSALTINLFAIWGYRVVYENTASTQKLMTYVPMQISSNNFTANAKLVSNDVFTKEHSTLLGWSNKVDGKLISYEDFSKEIEGLKVLGDGTLQLTGSISQKAKTFYSIWLNGNGSEEYPFQISTMNEWNRAFKYLNVADRYYLDDYGNKIYITEKITLNERYPEVSGSTTNNHVLINENCYIEQTKTFEVKTDPLYCYDGVFVGNYLGSNYEIRVGVDNTILFDQLGVSLEQGSEERIAKISNLTITMLTGAKNQNAILAYYSNNSEIKNCKFNINVYKEPVTGSSIRGIGGVFQRAYSKTQFIDCSLTGNIEIKLAANSLYKSIGGYVGYGQANFVNCTSKANIKVSENVGAYAGSISVGGFVGRSYHDKLDTLVSTIENCETLVSIIDVTLLNANYSVGGFVGVGNVIFKGENTNNVAIKSNYSLSTKWKEDKPTESTAKNYIRLGGFVGNAMSIKTENLMVKDAEGTESIVSPKLINNGEITANSKAFENNTQDKYLIKSQTYIGGIAGSLELVDDLELNNIKNIATLNSITSSTNSKDSSISYIGGLFGAIIGDSYKLEADYSGDNVNDSFTLYYKLALSNVENTGIINSTEIQVYQGGLVGYIDLGENYSKLTLNNVKNEGIQNINSIGGNYSEIKVGGLVGSAFASAYIGYDNNGINETYTSENNGHINLIAATNRTTGSVQVGGAIGCMTKSSITTNTPNNYPISVTTINTDAYINNFTNNGNILEKLNHNSNNIIVGGIIGASGTSQLTKVINNGQIKIENKTNMENRDLKLYVGGIIGLVSDDVINENSLRIKSNNIADIIKIIYDNQTVILGKTIDLIDKDELVLSFQKNTDFTYPNTLIDLIKEIDCTVQYEKDIASIIDEVTNRASINVDAKTYVWSVNGIGGIVGYHKYGELQITNTINDRVGVVTASEHISITSNMANTYSNSYNLSVGGIVGFAEAARIDNLDGTFKPALQIKSKNKEKNNVINYQEILINSNYDDVNLAIGGIVGYGGKPVSIDYAKNLGKIRLDILNAKSNTSLTSGAIGGIVGKVVTGDYRDITTITNSINGNSKEDQTIIEINTLKTTNTNAVLSVGGIIGHATSIINIIDCVNYNTIRTVNEIRSALRIGGIAGLMTYGKISASSTNKTITNTGNIILSTTSTINNNAVVYVGGIVASTRNIILDNVSSNEIIVGSPSYYNTANNCIGGLIGYLETYKFTYSAVSEGDFINKLSTGNFIENCITAPIQFTGEANCFVGGAIGYVYGEAPSNEVLNLTIRNTKSPTSKEIVVNVNDTTNVDIDNNIICVGGMIGRLDKLVQTIIGNEQNLNEFVENNMNITVSSIYKNKNTTHVGGMIGYAYNTRYSYLNNGLYLNNCVNKGQINVGADSANIGGLIGYTTDANIVNCKNTSNVKDYTNELISGISRMGGLVGYSVGDVEMYLSRYDGGSVSNTTISTLAGISMVGGLIGRIDGSAIIEDCFVRIAKFDIAKNINPNDEVSIERSNLSLGGFVGFYDNKTFNQLEIYHSYAKVTTLYKAVNNNVLIGGLVGKVKNTENLSTPGNSTYNFNDLQFTTTLGSFDIGNVSGYSNFDNINIKIQESNIWSNSGDIVIKEDAENSVVTITYVRDGGNSQAINVAPRTYVMIDQYCNSYIYNNKDGIIREFLGWSEKENGSVQDIKYHFGDMAYVAKNITLYPVYKEVVNNSEKAVPGTSMNPYIINSQEDWNTILVSNAYVDTTSSSLVKYFKLGKDIELNSDALSITKFNGVFDGSSYTLTLKDSKIPFIEIAGTIRNLKVVSNGVQTYTYNDTTFASCLAVYLNGGIIDDVEIFGRLQTSAQVIGSIVAHAYSGYIYDCESSVEMELVNIDSNKTTFGGLVGTSGYIRNNSGENKGELLNIVEYSPVQPVTFNSDENTVQPASFALVIEDSKFIDGRTLQENDPNRGLTIRYLNATDGVVTEGGNVPSIQGGLLGSSTQNVLIYNVKTDYGFVKFNRGKGSTGGLIGCNLQGLVRFENCNYNNNIINIFGGDYYGNFLGRSSSGVTYTQIINCKNAANIIYDNSVTSTSSSIGGFIGFGSGVYIKESNSIGIISTALNIANVGGFVGYIEHGGVFITDSECILSTDLVSEKDLVSEINATNFGGLIGFITGANQNKSFGGIVSYVITGKILRSNVQSKITGSITNFGGLIGRNNYSITIEDSNETKVAFSGSSNIIGGIIGYAYSSATLINCSTQSTFNDVNLIGSGPAFGGLIGRLYDNITITGCSVLSANNSISLKSQIASYIGGFVGYAQNYSLKISSSKFNTLLTLDIPDASYIGGAIGYSNKTDIIVSSGTTIDLKTNNTAGNAIVTDYYGGVVGYLHNTAHYSDRHDHRCITVEKTTITIKNSTKGLIVGFMSEPYFDVEKINNQTQQKYYETYYRYTFKENNIFYNSTAKLIGNKDIPNDNNNKDNIIQAL